MKKLSFCIAAALLSLFLLRHCVFAQYLSYGSGDNQINIYQQFAQACFFLYKDWLSADVVTEPFGAVPMSFVSPETDYNYVLQSPFFFEFDYTPDINTKLLLPVHSADTFSIYDSNNIGVAQFEVKYLDTFLEQSAGYPKLILLSNGVLYSSDTLSYDAVSDTYKISLSLPKGEYQYQYITTNDEYLNLLGKYSIYGNWYITSLPYGFSRISPKDLSEELPSAVHFRWDVLSDEGDLFYEFYIGLNSSKGGLEKSASSPPLNAKDFLISALKSMKQYFWYMKIKNKHGAFIETDLFTFYTGGNVEKFYNAPNPFNPARGQETQFVFNMPETGTVKLTLYSEYGDKVYESETMNFQGDGENSQSIFYKGKDNSGRMLYNGTYIAVLTKKYGGQTKTEKCRALVIK